eukprot:jgi/Orpsp1_1/1189037/evm.model.d7180000069024.1
MKTINYIQEDVKKYYNEYKSNSAFAKLIGHIDLDKIDDNFCKKFVGNINNPYDYKFQFESHYDLFISSIVKKVENYHHLRIMYRLFNIENKPKQNEFVIHHLIETFSKNLDRMNMTKNDIQIIVYTLYKLVSDNNNYSIKNLIGATKKIFDEQEVNEIFIFILNNFTDELNDALVEKLIKSINDFSNSDVLEILSKLKNKKVKLSILQKLDNKVIKKKDIFDIPVSENLLFLLKFIEYGYFNYDDEQFRNVDYIRKTSIIIKDIIQELVNFNFDMDQLQNMYHLLKNTQSNNNNLKTRFFILSSGDCDSPIMKELYSKIVHKIKSCNTTLDKIEEIITIFSSYYPNEKRDIIENFKDLKDNLINNLISGLPENKFLNEHYEFEKLYREAHQISLLKDSKLFIFIHEYQKENYQEDDENTKSMDNAIFDKTKIFFFNLEKLFDLETENEINLKFLETIISKLEVNEIEAEINIMKKIFEIKENPTNKLNEKLILLNSRNKNIKNYEKIILLLNDFTLNSNEKRKKFEKAIDNLKNYAFLKDLVEINDSLKELKLNILNLNSKYNEYALSVIGKMYNEPKLIKFIKDKSVNDIHQMGEFIDDSEDFNISLADIDQLETCMTLLQELKDKGNGKSEKEFLDIFVKILKDNPNYCDIGIKFEDSSGKYSDFYELYTNHLNPNELNKVHIRRIYNYSIFTIVNQYPEYKCIVTYMNNHRYVKKDNDEMLELRTAALLRKKDQREQDYFEICEKFAIIISDIQEILKLLKIISSKGYFEDLEYKIIVRDGNALGTKIIETDKSISKIKFNLLNFIKINNDDKKDLKVIINELNDILDDQKNQIKNIYSNNPNTRMIHGRQLTYIYNFARNKSFENKYDELYEENNVSLHKIIKKASLLKENKRGIYSHSCRLEDIEINTVYCSLELTGEFPLAQTVLYCNEETSEDEIISFIYKSIKCDQNTLFIFIKPESLSREKKSLLIELLKELYSENPKQMVSCLLFIYSEGNKMDEFIMEIQKLPHHIYFDFKNNNNYKN